MGWTKSPMGVTCAVLPPERCNIIEEINHAASIGLVEGRLSTASWRLNLFEQSLPSATIQDNSCDTLA